MKARYFIAILILLSTSAALYGQSDVFGLKVYGFFQTSFNQADFNLSVPGFLPRDIDNKSNSFWLQQMNLFLSKDISDRFKSFIDLELTNAFSSDRNWGAFNVEEAWVRYSYSNALNVKGGLLIPNFNNLNQIKNRTILLPYIFRPFVYETAVKGILQNAAYVPQRAYLEVYGEFPLNELVFEYDVYAGNSEDSYIVSNTAGMSVPGTDSTRFKLVGGRLGIRYDDLKFGVSVTSDKSNQRQLGIGDIHRMRIGADISYSIAGFTLDAEYIAVNHNLSDKDKKTLKFISGFNPLITDKLDKQFYYATLTYNINDDWYIYGKYDFLKDYSMASLSNGMKGYSVGGGFKPVDDVVIKAQYQAMRGENGKIFKLNLDDFYVGASVFF